MKLDRAITSALLASSIFAVGLPTFPAFASVNLGPQKPVVTQESSEQKAERVATRIVKMKLTEKQAFRLISKAGLQARIAARDGYSYVLTADYRTNRINLFIKNGVVTKASIG